MYTNTSDRNHAHFTATHIAEGLLLVSRTQMAERGNVLLSEFACNLSVSDKGER